MKTFRQLFLAVFLGSLLLAPMALKAEEAKTYQVTGPVLTVTADTITVQKGSEKWQIARDKNTKVTGDPKVGSKVTITYQMTAANITVKESKSK